MKRWWRLNRDSLVNFAAGLTRDRCEACGVIAARLDACDGGGVGVGGVVRHGGIRYLIRLVVFDSSSSFKIMPLLSLYSRAAQNECLRSLSHGRERENEVLHSRQISKAQI